MHVTAIKVLNIDIMKLRLNEANHIERVNVICVFFNTLRAYEDVELNFHLFLNLVLNDEWSSSRDAIVY